MYPASFRRLLAALALGAAVAACTSGPKVHADADPSVDFTTDRTFGFFQQFSTDKSKYSKMLTTRLKDAARHQLQTRGYQESAQPQLLVNFNTNVENRTDVQSTPSSAGFYGYRSDLYGAWGASPQDVYTSHYQQGTLAINLVDASKQQLASSPQ